MSTTLAIYGSLLVAGLAGSLHCIGMCGPLVIAFSTTLGRGGFVWYHLGRIWTYGMLGLLAGVAGRGLREVFIDLGWQRPLSVVLATLVLASGLILAGLIPGLRLEMLADGCAFAGLRDRGWFSALVKHGGITSRLLLGAVMGLLPCGLVYAMLITVATLPSPAHAGLGMLLFGLGTVPSLAALLWAGRFLPIWVRRHGTRTAAILLIVAGVVMLGRAILIVQSTSCPLCG